MNSPPLIPSQRRQQLHCAGGIPDSHRDRATASPLIDSPTDSPNKSTSSHPLAADAQKLEAQAFTAISKANFDTGRNLLQQAENADHDPRLEQMLGWVNDYQKQLADVAKTRHTEFEQTVTDAHKLLDHHLDTFAVEEVRIAYLLADDKDAFRHEKWVDDLVSMAAGQASKAEDAQQWVTALNLYAALISLEPSNPIWKTRHKAVFRRARLLSDYAPERSPRCSTPNKKKATPPS